MKHYFLKLSAIKGIIKDVEEITDKRDNTSKISALDLSQVASEASTLIKKIAEL